MARLARLGLQLCRGAHGSKGALVADALAADGALVYGLPMLCPADAQAHSHEEVG